MSEHGLEERQFGLRARLALSPACELKADAQAHAARTMWNLLHAWWQMMPKEKRTLGHADAAIRQARKDIDFLAVLPAQAAQAVLKTYFQAWKNCWAGRAGAPNFKGRIRTVMSVDIPQGRDLNITRVHRRWGMVNIPKVGRVRFRWTKDLPVGKRAGAKNRMTGARLIKDALGWHIAFRVQESPGFSRESTSSHEAQAGDGLRLRHHLHRRGCVGCDGAVRAHDTSAAEPSKPVWETKSDYPTRDGSPTMYPLVTRALVYVGRAAPRPGPCHRLARRVQPWRGRRVGPLRQR